MLINIFAKLVAGYFFNFPFYRVAALCLRRQPHSHSLSSQSTVQLQLRPTLPPVIRPTAYYCFAAIYQPFSLDLHANCPPFPDFSTQLNGKTSSQKHWVKALILKIQRMQNIRGISLGRESSLYLSKGNLAKITYKIRISSFFIASRQAIGDIAQSLSLLALPELPALPKLPALPTQRLQLPPLAPIGLTKQKRINQLLLLLIRPSHLPSEWAALFALPGFVGNGRDFNSDRGYVELVDDEALGCFLLLGYAVFLIGGVEDFYPFESAFEEFLLASFHQQLLLEQLFLQIQVLFLQFQVLHLQRQAVWMRGRQSSPELSAEPVFEAERAVIQGESLLIPLQNKTIIFGKRMFVAYSSNTILLELAFLGLPVAFGCTAAAGSALDGLDGSCYVEGLFGLLEDIQLLDALLKIFYVFHDVSDLDRLAVPGCGVLCQGGVIIIAGVGILLHGCQYILFQPKRLITKRTIKISPYTCGRSHAQTLHSKTQAALDLKQTEYLLI